MEIIDNGPDGHWGSYDGVDHGYDNRMLEAIGQPAPSALGQPGFSVPPPYEMNGVIKQVRSDQRPAVVMAMSFMTQPSAPPAGGSLEYDSYPTISPAAWVEGYVAQGNTVLIDVLSPPSANGNRMIAVVGPGAGAATSVRALSVGNSKYAVVAGPPDVIANASMPPSGVVDCPPGQVMTAQGCKVAPGPAPPGPVTPPGIPPRPPLVPEKAAIAGSVILGVVLVGGVTYWAYSRRKR
ncbi:MAG: hypothetical protein ACYTFO_01715 [Planctomycetota bacterium]|jgi:hypothetical protein